MPKLTPVEFCGLATLLGAKLPATEEDEDVDISGVIEQMFDKFVGLEKKKRHEILKMMRQAKEQE